MSEANSTAAGAIKMVGFASLNPPFTLLRTPLIAAGRTAADPLPLGLALTGTVVLIKVCLRRFDFQLAGAR